MSCRCWVKSTWSKLNENALVKFVASPKVVLIYAIWHTYVNWRSQRKVEKVWLDWGAEIKAELMDLEARRSAHSLTLSDLTNDTVDQKYIVSPECGLYGDIED